MCYAFDENEKVDSNSAVNLKKNLLEKDEQTEKLRVNFDNSIVRLLREAKYFLFLGLKVFFYFFYFFCSWCHLFFFFFFEKWFLAFFFGTKKNQRTKKNLQHFFFFKLTKKWQLLYQKWKTHAVLPPRTEFFLLFRLINI